MRLKEKKILQKFAAILKKFSAQGAKKVDYGRLDMKLDFFFRLVGGSSQDQVRLQVESKHFETFKLLLQNIEDAAMHDMVRSGD